MTARRSLIAALVLGAATAATAAMAGGDVVVNGGFEAGGALAAWKSLAAGSSAVAGWRIDAGTGALVGRYWSASGGSNSFEVGSPGAGSIAQTVRTRPGQSYRLSFALAGNPEGPPRVKLLDVSAGPTRAHFTFDTAGRSRGAMGWTTHTLDFTAVAAATTIRFSRPDGGAAAWYGPVIDDVAVTEAGGAPVASSAPLASPNPTPTALPPPAATAAPRAYAPPGADPYSGVWSAAYPGKPLRVYVDHHGRDVSGHAVDGGAAIPPGTIAFVGHADGSPIVVLAKCADADARGWHGAVLEWTGANSFRLHVANCHAGDVAYTRVRGQ